MPKVIVVSSISGSGKTTLVNQAETAFGIMRLKTCTTRPMRPEENGDEYYFMSDAEFNKNLAKDGFVEHATVYAHSYGLLKSEVEKNADKNCIVILDVQGMHNITSLYDNVVTVFIKPPSLSEIKHRLLERNTSVEDVEKRMSEVIDELKHIEYYDHSIRSGSREYMWANFKTLLHSILS